VQSIAKPWARMRRHGPCLIFDYHATEAEAREAIAASAVRNGEQVQNIQTVAYFPDLDSNKSIDKPSL
jgi:hypothetical protein